jgi:hypothetical protein|tara:strand:- start:1259 stop:1501 length:243 start_codon:yes stop_codon:yes gene_type:complete
MTEDINYIELEKEDREYLQQMVYYEYAEALLVIRERRPESILTLRIMLKADLNDSEDTEDYERCMLYSDMLKNKDFRLDD